MLRLLSPALLCAALAAQTQTQAAVAANRFVPADSFAVARVAAPAAWRQQFAKTQVAKLLQAPHVAPLVGEMTKGVDQILGMLRDSGKFDAELVDKLLTSYRGDVTFSVQVDWEDVFQSMQESRPPAFSIVIAMSPDGSYDLTALASAIQDFVEKETEQRRPLKDLTVGDLRLRVTSDGDEMQACVPTMIDGQLVMLLASDIEKAAPRLLATDHRFEGDLPKKPLFAHVRLDGLMSTLLELIESQLDGSGMMPVEIAPIVRKFGLAALKSMTMTVDADDKHSNSSLQIAMGEGDLGILGAMMIDKPPKLLRYLPAGCEQFGSSHMDVHGLYKTVMDIWREFGDEVPLSAASVEKAFADGTKVRLDEDLLAHLGDEMLMMQDPSLEWLDAEVSENNPLAAMGGSCLAISLRDGKAFEQNLETALRSRGMHATRKTEEYADTKVHSLRVAALLDVEYAVTDDLLLVVLGKGEAGRRNLRGVLDARKRGGEGELPANVKKGLAAMPDGYSGVAVMPIAAMLGGFSTVLVGMSTQAADGEELRKLADMLHGVTGDLQQLGLEHIVSATYVKGRTTEVRYRW